MNKIRIKSWNNYWKSNNNKNNMVITIINILFKKETNLIKAIKKKIYKRVCSLIILMAVLTVNYLHKK